MQGKKAPTFPAPRPGALGSVRPHPPAGLFVGSGAVEAGCKAVIGQRLKLSGMRWTVVGAGAITALRCRQASLGEIICRAPHNRTGAA